MTEEKKIKAKIKLTETNIKLTKEIIELNKKDSIRMIFINTLAFFALLLINIENKELGFISVFGISLFTSSVYSYFDKMTTENRNNKFKLINLEIDLKYYKSLLDKK